MNRIISRNTSMRLPHQSLDLHPIDLLLWALSAALVYVKRPQSIIVIKETVSFLNSAESQTVAEVVERFLNVQIFARRWPFSIFSKISRLVKVHRFI